MFFDPPIFREGSRQVSAGSLTRLSEEVARQSGTANSLSGIEGIHDLPPGPDATLARIVGKGDVSGGQLVPYLWLAVTPTNTDGSTPLYADNPAFGFGTAAQYPLYEAAGNRDVPVDGSVVVTITPAGDGSHFTFQAPAETLVPFRITGDLGTGKYSAVEEEEVTAGAYADLSGGIGTSLLYEENNTAGIAVNTVVYARRAYGSGYPHVLVWVDTFGDDTAVSNIQSVRIRGATGGTFTLTFDDDTTGLAPNPQTTAAIAWNASGAAVKAAIEALSNVTTVNVTGAGTDTSPYLVELADDFASHPLFVADYSALTGHQEWVFDGSGLVSPGITVEEADGTPSYTGVATLQFNQAAGFVVTQPSAGVALASQTAATTTAVGYVTIANQLFGGDKGAPNFYTTSGDGRCSFISTANYSGVGGTFGYTTAGNDPHTSTGTYLILTYGGGTAASKCVLDSAIGVATYDATNPPCYAVNAKVGGIHQTFTGVYGTLPDGSTISGGLITTIGAGSSASIAVGTTPVSGGAVGDLLTIGAGPVVSSASLSSLLDGLGGVTGAF